MFRESTVLVEFGTALGFRHPLGDLGPCPPWIRGATVVLFLLGTVAFLWPEILQTSVDCFLLCILLDFTFSQLKIPCFWNKEQGILQDQGSNVCLLHWKVDSLPLSHQGSAVSGVLG